MGTNKKYWKGLDELNQTPEFLEKSEKEFPAELSVDEFLGDEKIKETSAGRRDFLKFLGFCSKMVIFFSEKGIISFRKNVPHSFL